MLTVGVGHRGGVHGGPGIFHLRLVAVQQEVPPALMFWELMEFRLSR
jgi:hypothetical protein